MNPAHVAIVSGLLAAWGTVLFVRDGRTVPGVHDVSVKFTHALPAAIQSIVFGYWASYWPEAFAHLAVIAVQLAVAYVFDFLLTWTLRRPYSLGLGPVPIVMSANLFIWFAPGDLLMGTLVIAIALSSKALLVSGGRHIFNPSVLGVSVVGALCILLPRWFTYEDISAAFGRPPYMPYLILALALIPQVRLRTTPVSVGIVAAMVGMMLTVFALTGDKHAPSPWWPPWLLALTLLAPDPATIPKGLLARFLFGLFIGTSFYVSSKMLEHLVGTDYFAKVMPIVVANYMVPAFERAGAAASRRVPQNLYGAESRFYMAAWASIWALIFLVSRWNA
jgi:hypothetical protein